MKHSFLLIPVLLLCLSMSAVAQSTDDESEEDPFKNDPFFSKPISEFFQKSSDSSDHSENHSHEEDKRVQRQLHQLNESGIDYEDFLEAGPYNSSSLYSLYPNLPMIHYNRVSGVFLGLEKERMQWYGNDWLLNIPSIQTHGLIGYSFGQDEWNYSVGLEKLFGRKKYMMVGAEYYDAMATDDFWRVGLTETTVTSLLAGYDYLDYYKQQGYGTYLVLRSQRFFEGGVSFNDHRYNSLMQETDWSLFGGDNYRTNPPIEYISNLPVDTVQIRSLTFAGSFNPKRLVLSDHFTFSLNGMMEMADPGIGKSEYAYNKFVGEMTTFINFEPGGVLKWRLKTGAIAGEAPNFKEFQLGGIGSLRALPYKSLDGTGGTVPIGSQGSNHYANQMFLSNAEIQFGSPSYSSSEWIDFDDFYLSFFWDSGWANYSIDLADSDNPFTDFLGFEFDDLRHNGGIGIGSSLIRAELAWDLNDTDRAPVLWIRLNPTF